MTEKRFPKKEFIILSVGEALCVLVTVLGFLGVSVFEIIEFEFSYKVITGALFGAVVALLNFIFLSVSVNKAVDEYMALRGDKEMTDEEAEEFAKKNAMLIQNAVKKSYMVRTGVVMLTLVVVFLLDWFNPLATVIPILSYQPILTWGNHLYESVKRIMVRMQDEKASEAAHSEEQNEEARTEIFAEDSEIPKEHHSKTEDMEAPDEKDPEDKSLEEPIEDDFQKADAVDTSDSDDMPQQDSDELDREEPCKKVEDEEVALEKNEENTEGSDVDGL